MYLYIGPRTPNATITAQGGPWALGGCSIQSAGALALRARREANISLAFCFVGGAGALCERATDGLVARYSNFLLTGTKIRIMTKVRSRDRRPRRAVLNFLALLVQKYE